MAIIAVVKGVVELASTIKKCADEFFERKREAKPQTLRLKSAVGTVVVKSAPGTTLEQLQQALAPLTAIE